MRRITLRCIGAVVAAAVVAIAPAPASAAARQRTSMSAILPQVMCVTCGIPLQAAVSPQADAERDYIQRLIDRGDSAAQVKRALVAQYGSAVLALPPASGFNLAVYIVPIVVAALLLLVVAILLGRWRGNLRRAVGGGSDAVTALSTSDAARLDADLARYDPPRRPRGAR
ncbi:MAG: cytochrome c-type biogenesis protein CcmH [Solirubrobacteraceae bacterium]